MLAAAGAEDRRQLEQAHVLLLAATVVRDRVEQPGQQRRPHHRHRLGQRVGDGDDVGVGGEAARGVARDEREGDALGEAGGAGQRAQPGVARQPRRRARRRQLERRERLRDPVVAVDAGELLEQVRFAGDVDAPARHGHRPPVAVVRGREREAQRGQDPFDRRVVDRVAEDAGDAGPAQRQRPGAAPPAAPARRSSPAAASRRRSARPAPGPARGRVAAAS